MALKRPRRDSSPMLSSPRGRIQQEHAEFRTTKFAQIEASVDDASRANAMICSLPPHAPQEFPGAKEYEAHVALVHDNRCRECRKNFPSPRFLDLHITENHDPFFASKRDANKFTDCAARGDLYRIYACFLSDCPKVCADWKKRRSHLIAKHGFPRNYDFFVVNSGIDGRTSMLRTGVDEHGHRASSRDRTAMTAYTASAANEARPPNHGEQDVAVSIASATGETSTSNVVEQITVSMQRASLQPALTQTISFGKRKGKAGFAKS